MTAYMDFLITSFWHSVLGHNFAQPNFTDLMRLTESIVRVHYRKKMDANPEEYEEYHKKEHERYLQILAVINEKVTESVNTPLATIEFMVFKNWQKPPDASIIVHGKEFKMFALFNELNKAVQQFVQVVNDIGMNYSLDTEYGASIFGGAARPEQKGLSLGKKIKGDA